MTAENNNVRRNPTRIGFLILITFSLVGLVLGALVSPQCIVSNEDIYKTQTPLVVGFFIMMAGGGLVAFLRPHGFLSEGGLAVITGLSVGTAVFTFVLLATNQCIPTLS
jgi:hypothetical protein